MTPRLVARLALVVAALAVIGTLAVARTSTADQCAVPVSQRTGGWFCASP